MNWRDYSLIWLTFVVMAALVARDWWRPDANYAPPPAPGRTLTCTLDHISDGDSLTARCEDGLVSVRFHGIDAPEMGQAPWGEQSREALRALLREGDKTLQLMIRDTDRYNRSVAVVMQGKRNIGLLMVAQGHAVVYRQYNRDPEYATAERRAKAQRLGIWQQPGSQQDPGKWRRYHPR